MDREFSVFGLIEMDFDFILAFLNEGVMQSGQDAWSKSPTRVDQNRSTCKRLRARLICSWCLWHFEPGFGWKRSFRCWGGKLEFR